MSQFLESFEVFDLALGKPPLYCLPSSASVRDAIAIERELGLTEISVWDPALENCEGVLHSLDVLCFLAADESLRDLDAALAAPIANLVHQSSIQRMDLHDRLTKALELMIQGVQYLIVPLPHSMKRSRRWKASEPRSSRWPTKELCWISQEAVMRFLMSCIPAFCPLPLFAIEELGIINRNFISIGQDAQPIDALHLIREASSSMSAVAVVAPVAAPPPPLIIAAKDDDRSSATLDDRSSTTLDDRSTATLDKLKLLGDISSSSLRNWFLRDPSAAAAALATLSAQDFLSYARGSNKRSSRHLAKIIESRLANKMDEDRESCEESSDSEHDSRRLSSSSSGSFHGSNREWLTCRPWSSLAAVMAQALSHQSSYIWVTDSDVENNVVGIVTYVDMIRVLVRRLDKFGRLGSSQKLFSSTPKLITRRE